MQPLCDSSVSSTREKMILLILLILTLNLGVHHEATIKGGTFEVNVIQHSYQAERNKTVTLEWTFTTDASSSLDNIDVFCAMFRDHEELYVLRLNRGKEVPKDQDKHFAGRVHCDRDALIEGRLRLHISSLRDDDSGWYFCEVMTNDGAQQERCYLSVTVPEVRHKTETKLETEQKVRPVGSSVTEPIGANNENLGWSIFYCAMLLGAAVLSVWYFKFHCSAAKTVPTTKDKTVVVPVVIKNP